MGDFINTLSVQPKKSKIHSESHAKKNTTNHITKMVIMELCDYRFSQEMVKVKTRHVLDI